MQDDSGMSNNLVTNGSTPAKKSSKGMVIGMAICAVLGLAGVGFGVYGMMRANNESTNNSTDVEVQVKSEDGTLTTLETEQIETKTEDGKTVAIIDSLVHKNPVLTKGKMITTTHGYSTSTSFAKSAQDPSDKYILELVLENGKISYCNYLPETLKKSADYLSIYAKNNCDLGIKGNIYKIVEHPILGGSSELLLFIMEDGTVEYLPAQDAFDKSSSLGYNENNIKSYGKLDIDDFIVDAIIDIDRGAGQPLGVLVSNTGNVIDILSLPQIQALAAQ